jgi:maleate cis-trans isomerase
MTYRPYGWRARIGLIVPNTNTVNEAEWARMAPDGVSIHVARMALHGDLDAAVASLVPAGPDVIAYGCTAGSLDSPLERWRELGGVPAVATAPAILRALQAFGARRIALATPYDDALNRHEMDFFARHGIETCSCKGLGIGAGGPHEYGQIARVDKEAVARHARSADHPAADALVISCTDLATLEALPALERELAKPVISSNLATWWLALRTAGIQDHYPRHGRLLAEH